MTELANAERGRASDKPIDILTRRLFEDVQRRFKPFPVPSDRIITPLELSPEMLSYYGLPPKPHADTQPGLYRAWLAAFGGKIELEPFSLTLEDFASSDFETDFRQVGSPLPSATRFETSRNWSGAFIAADNDRVFRQVWGSWTAPTFANFVPGPGTDPYTISAWIGLDGQRTYFNSSLPQIGTTTILKSPYAGTPQCFAWTQWWDRESDTTLPVPIAKFPVDQGDSIACSLLVVDPVRVWFSITNMSRIPHKTTTVNANSPWIKRQNGLMEQPRVSGATAEWIFERPLIPYTKTFANFPPYLPMQFSLCSALAVELPAVGIPLVLNERDLSTARFIRMFERRNSPPRTAYISMPSRVGDDGVALTYGDFRN